MLKFYELELDVRPRIKLRVEKVYRIKGFITEGKSKEEMDDIADILEEFYRSLPFNFPMRFVVLGKEGQVQIAKRGSKKRKEFLRRYEEFLKKNVNAREVKTYLVLESSTKEIEDALSQVKTAGVEVFEDKEGFFRDLAYFFGGNEEDPLWLPIEEWDWGVKVGERYGAVLVNTSSPSVVYPLHFDFLNRITEDFIFVLNFKKVPTTETQTKLEGKISLLEKQERESKQEIAKELRDVVRLLEQGKESVSEYTAVLTLFKKDEKEAYELGKTYEFILRRTGLEFSMEGTAEFDAFLSLFRWNYKKLKELGYVRTIVSSAFSYMLPLSSLPEGAKEGMMLFSSGLTPFALDLYKVPPPNMTVLGQMGSGKSVFLQNFALFQDYVVFVERIHESEGSYTVFTKMFNGNYYPISLDRPVSINPFGDTIYTVDVVKFIQDIGYSYDDFSEVEFNNLRDILNGYFFDKEKITKEELLKKLRKHKGTEALAYYIEKADWKEWKISHDIDRDKLVFLKMVLSLMYSLGTGKEIDPAIVEDVILETYRKVCKGKPKAEREILMRDFYGVAKEKGYEELARRWKSYTMEGAYGNFFDKPCDVHLAEYVFFEIRTKDREILPLVVLSILTNIVKWFSKPDMGDKRKGVVLDEAWFFTGDKTIMEFVEEALRTYRKKGIFIVLASQLAKDFGEGAGAVIKSTCPYNVFLYSDNTEHDNIARVFKFNGNEVEILKDIKRPADYEFKYSKFYLRTPYTIGGQKVRGVFHLIPSREFYWIATTHPQDKVKREEYKNKYKDLATAIEMLAKEDEEKL